MEPDTVRLLEGIPDELQARGWQLVPRETKIFKQMGASYHVAVYQRPYHSPVDHLGTALTVRGGYVYVSTREARSTTWEEAREAAIAQMLSIDAPPNVESWPRTPARRNPHTSGHVGTSAAMGEQPLMHIGRSPTGWAVCG